MDKLTNYSCSKCNSSIFQKHDGGFRNTLIGDWGIKAFPRYYCENCGSIKYKDFPNPLKNETFRARLKFFVVPILFLIILYIIKL